MDCAISNDEPFVISIFGIQYPSGEANEDQQRHTNDFNALVNEKPAFVYRLMQDGCGSISHGKTFVWLAYLDPMETTKRGGSRKMSLTFGTTFPVSPECGGKC